MRGAARRNETGGYGDDTDEARDQDEGQRIDRARLNEQAAQKQANSGGARQADRQSDRQQREAAADEEPDHLWRLCPERHPHADLMAPLTHRICGSGENADHGRQQRDIGECRQYPSPSGGAAAGRQWRL